MSVLTTVSAIVWRRLAYFSRQHNVPLRALLSSSSMDLSSLLRIPRPGQGISQTALNVPPPRPHAIALFPGDYDDDDEDYDDERDAEGYDGEGGDWDDDEEAKIAARDEEEEEFQDAIGEQLRKLEIEDKLRSERWIRNSLPPERTSIVDERGRAYGRGGRKTAEARVWIQAGYGHIVVNRRALEEYFPRLTDRDLVLQPLVATKTCGKMDVHVQVQGGGLRGQAGAIRHGLARALNHYNPHVFRPPLKFLGYLTRDSRMVERKKIGHKKARKSPQWVRR